MQENIRKELILISPKCGGFIVRNLGILISRMLYPMSLYTIAAITPKDYKVRIFNAKTIWLKRDYPKGALVGITSFTRNISIAYQIADRYRKAGCFVVMGGPHVSVLTDEALKHCDSVVIGEAESVWQEVLYDFENKSLKPRYIGQPVEDWHSLVFDYLYCLKPRVLNAIGIYTSRGCKYNCKYCVIATRSKESRNANLDQVIKLIEKIKKASWVPFIFFRDDNIFSNPKYAKELFRRMIPLRLRWQAFTSIDIALDDEALELAKESGCMFLFIGFESIYPKRLEKASYLSSSEDYLKLIKKIKRKGIKIIGSFMIGFDYYTHLDYLRLIIFIARAFLFLVVMTILTPFPGTRLYDELLQENRLSTRDWDKYGGFNLVFKPKNMAAFALTAWYIIIRFISIFFAVMTLLLVLYLLLELFTFFRPFFSVGPDVNHIF